MAKAKRTQLAEKLQHHDDDASSSSSSSKSSSSLALQTSFLEPEVKNLADELAALGFDGADAFVTKNDPERIRRALESVKRRPPGSIRNIPGFIRYLVKTPGAIKMLRTDDPDKYVKGKFGHLVKR